MNYTLNQLQIFLKITKTKSITKAAEELNLTQPAVSIQLKNFQDQFKIPLTEIVGRKLYITDFGLEIATAAEEIIDQVNAINNKTLAYKGQLVGRLKITVVSTGKYVMPYLLADFLRENPGVDLEMDVTNKSSVIGSLENNEVDFSLVSIIPPSLNVEKLDILKNKLYLIGRNDRSLSKKKKIELENLPFIFRESGSGTRQIMNQYLKESEINVTRRFELTSNEAVKQSVLAGMGYSLMPLIGIKNELLNNELRIIEMKGLPIVTNWNLIWLVGKKHSLVASAFLEYLNKNLDSIVKEHFAWYENY